MGKIKVRGYAERKIEVDECIYTIRFSHTDVYEAEAIRRVKENSEEFLKVLKDNGIDLSKVQLSDDNILRAGTNKTCSRELKIVCDASTKTNNFMLGIVRNNKIEASITTNYKYSKIDELHKELLSLAVKDSKQKAEIIALASDSKVLSIDYMSFDRYDCEDDYEEYLDNDNIKCCLDRDAIPTQGISDELANKLNVEREEVFITWNVQ